MNNKAELSETIGQIALVKRRAVIYHEGGNLIILNMVLLLLNFSAVLFVIKLQFKEKVYAVPGIYNNQKIDVKWGPNGH